jgi:hypothetical protein
LLCRETARPPVGAGLLIVTVPVELAPPTTFAGLRVSEINTGGLMVRAELIELPARVPLMLATFWTETATVLIVTAPEDFPAAISTSAGSVAALTLLERDTLIPPAGAGPVSETVAFDEAPPWTVAGLNTIDAICGGLMVRFAV